MLETHNHYATLKIKLKEQTKYNNQKINGFLSLQIHALFIASFYCCCCWNTKYLIQHTNKVIAINRKITRVCITLFLGVERVEVLLIIGIIYQTMSNLAEISCVLFS